MQNEKRADLEQLKTVIINRLKAVVTNEKGEVAPGFEGIFDEFQTDDMGNPVIQTVAGMIMIDKEILESGSVRYSPNMGVEAESLCSEVMDINEAISEIGYKLLICTGHYVDPQGQIAYGDEARKVKRHVETSVLLNTIREMQKEQESIKPRLILPDSKIVTR